MYCILPIGFYYSENWELAKEKELHCVYTPENLKVEGANFVVYIIKELLVERLIDELTLISQIKESTDVRLNLIDIYEKNKGNSVWFLVEIYDPQFNLQNLYYYINNQIIPKDIIYYKAQYESENYFGLFIYGDKKPKRATFTSIIYSNELSDKGLLNPEVGILNRILIRFEKKQILNGNMDIKITINDKLFNTYKRRERCLNFSNDL
ncbi:MAG: hypothetical protein MH132_13115 [Hydrotalea sp.]|nr:hypothetical protein [Hydrotalea sp.]